MISLGVDIGGTGCKCAAFREDGIQAALSYCEYPLAAGMVNLPQEVLLQSALQVISECVKKLEDPAEVAAITVSSFGESFAAVDENGDALGDILLYFGNSETREFRDLVEQIGIEKIMKITRILPDASYSLSKMLFTLKTAPRPVWKFLFIAGFICYKLCGNPVTDVSLACRSLLYDVDHLCWSQELLDASGVRREQLPEVLPTGSIAGNLLPEIAGKLGLSAEVKVVIGAHDQIVNALGAGVLHPGEAADTSGTCECITPLFDGMPDSSDFPENNFACVPYLSTGGYVTYAYNISAGSVVRWYRDALGGALKTKAAEKGVSIYDIMNAECPDEPTKLMVLPFLQGMGGTPDVDPAATGLIAGLTTQTRLPDLYRAILEGVTFEMRYNQEKLQQAGVRLQTIFACGGGARSAKWLQVKADILGCRIIPVETEETGAMGSAILGFAAVRRDRSVAQLAEAFSRHRPPIDPIPENAAYYAERFAFYKEMRRFYTGH